MIQRSGSANWKTEYWKSPKLAEKRKRIVKNEDSLRDLWDNIKHNNSCTRRASEEEERKKSEDIFEKITAENSPNLGKETGSGSTRSP